MQEEFGRDRRRYEELRERERQRHEELRERIRRHREEAERLKAERDKAKPQEENSRHEQQGDGC